MTKEYLGDGVYCELQEDGQTKLTVENGIDVLQTIYLESQVVKALINYWLIAKILIVGEIK